MAAICTALSVLAKNRYIGRPLKWIWRRLVSDPLSTWFNTLLDHKLEPIRAELSFNSGATTKDAVARVEVTTQELASAMKRIEAAVSSSDHALALHITKFHPVKETP